LNFDISGSNFGTQKPKGALKRGIVKHDSKSVQDVDSTLGSSNHFENTMERRNSARNTGKLTKLRL
jgi:hypothetical protein